MAYWRIILKGTLGTTETWSIGAAYGIVGIAPDVPDQAAADGILTNIKAAIAGSGAIPAALQTLMSAQCTAVTARVEKRAENESILTVSEGLLSAPVSGTGTSSKSPQDALVFSLRTNTPGPRGRGRIYWPALGASLSTSFQLSTPTPAAAVAGAKTMLQAFNTAIDNYYIGIASALRSALAVRSLADHTCRNVVSVQVGTTMDTQRRRRESIPETYTTVAYP
jgi:hypothetical protein